MPIHDWTLADAASFYDFHERWTAEICSAINHNELSAGYTANVSDGAGAPEPDVIAHVESWSPTVLNATNTPPRVWRVMRADRRKAAFARKASHIVIRHDDGQVVAVIEIVSPGNKDSKNAIRAFKTKAVEFLSKGISLVVVDLFPPTPRDPAGIHEVIWGELVGEPFEARPADKPLTIASYDAALDLTAYVDPVAVGDVLPDAPLFLAAGWYVNIPLEQTYMASWENTPAPIREMVMGPA